MAAGKLIMQIHGTHQVHGPHGLNGPHAMRPQGGIQQAPAQPTDQLDISPAAQAASMAEASGEVRADLVARLRAEIADGTYESPDKLDRALDRLLDTLG